MLAETLSYTTPPDILALSRTSRYFCTTLVVNPASQFIWRHARKRFHPLTIPDPSPNWTESAYAAFIFDPAPCEICHKVTHRTPYSSSLRARLCILINCQMAWLSQQKKSSDVLPEDAAHTAAVQSWLPWHDSYVYPGPRFYRKEEWDAAMQEHKASVQDPDIYSNVQQEFARKAKFLKPTMAWATKLDNWGRHFEKYRADANTANIQFLKDKATKERWELKDFFNTPLYMYIRKFKDVRGEKLTNRDYRLLRDQFREQVAKCRETRVRRAIENSARVNRDDIRSYWNTLKTVGKGPLPSYPEFRRLPMVSTLVSKNTTEALALDDKKQTVKAELCENEVTRNHIQQNIDVWLHDKRKKLAQKLGDPYPSLPVPSGFVHPVERTTAWFRCTKCNRVGRSLEDVTALSFANVCAHQCLGRPKKERLHGAWDADWFEPDLKAIAAAKELLRVCGLREQKARQASLDEFGCRFLCKSCENPIVMDAASVIGHCKRHETITLELLTHDQAKSIMKTPVERGLYSKLMGYSKSSKKERAEKAYGCRHCEKQPLTFNGMRSHVKKSHGIKRMRDEDFLRVPPDPKKDASHWTSGYG